MLDLPLLVPLNRVWRRYSILSIGNCLYTNGAVYATSVRIDEFHIVNNLLSASLSSIAIVVLFCAFLMDVDVHFDGIRQ